MRSHPEIGAPHADLHAAMLDQCEWADNLGFDYVWLSEHHGSEDGYMPSPLIAAAAIAARTSRIRIHIAALLLPLHDPIRIAEDLAVVDLISRGRLEVVLAGGYVPSEFEMFGKHRRRRPRLMTEGSIAIRKGFSGEPFPYDGRMLRVTPRPHRQPGPLTYLGGASEGAVRRAVELRASGMIDGYEGGSTDLYREECERLGVDPGWMGWPPRKIFQYIFLSSDPEGDWNQIAPFAMHESRSYVRWSREGNQHVGMASEGGPDVLRRERRYGVVTPEEGISLLRERAPNHITFHPLVGGLDPSFGWKGLRLFEHEVLPPARQEGLL